MNPRIKIAVLTTCHNRKNTTIRCLRQLYNQVGLENTRLQLIAVDDGSTDGTAQAILKMVPDAVILHGNGELFWCGGMRAAWSAAIEDNYDYYLWLNDDTKLFPDALRRLVDTSMSVSSVTGKDIILTGSLMDEDRNQLLYGGKEFNPCRPKTLRTIRPLSVPRACDVVNGNCVLVTERIAKAVGNFSPEFRHAAADYDFCLRAKSKGFSSWTAPGFVGTSTANPIKNINSNHQLSLKHRLAYLTCDASIMRIKDSIVFSRKYGKISFLTSMRYHTSAIFLLCIAKVLARRKKALNHHLP